MKYSSYQRDIFEFIANPSLGSAQVEAVAGSGKTTTIVEASSLLEESATKCFLAFNKAIAMELKDKLPQDVHSSTFNSLGFKVYRREFNGTLDKDKTKKLLIKRGYTVKDSILWDSIRCLSQLKALSLLPDDEDFSVQVNRIQDINDLGLPPNPESFFRELLNESNKNLSEIDFDDQLYLPIIYNMYFPKFDGIFVDESQDLSPVQIEILSRIMNGGSRIFCVGDTRQAIYAFRGADPRAISLLRDRFNLSVLPLSISYRCPISVVEEAKKIVPEIEASPFAEQGLVEDREGKPKIEDLAPGTLTLCRMNAPLFSIGLQLILSNKPCVLQTNMVDGIIGLIYSLDTKNTDVLMQKMEDFYQEQKAEFIEKGHNNRLKILEDKRDCIMLLCQTNPDKKVSSIINNLKKLKLGRVGPVLSTIHKAKGTEANTVFFLRDYAKEEFIRSKTSHPIQEDNLLYVGITRAKKALFFHDIGDKDES